jgi:hypothetical protein
MGLDDVFTAKEDIAKNVKEELQKSMSAFGFQVGPSPPASHISEVWAAACCAGACRPHAYVVLPQPAHTS